MPAFERVFLDGVTATVTIQYPDAERRDEILAWYLDAGRGSDSDILAALQSVDAEIGYEHEIGAE